MTLLKELMEGMNWPVSDIVIDKVNDYIDVESEDEYFEMANEQWSDSFTDEQVDKGIFDEFIEYAYARHQKDRGK
jgi:hypothetical protein